MSPPRSAQHKHGATRVTTRTCAASASNLVCVARSLLSLSARVVSSFVVRPSVHVFLHIAWRAMSSQFGGRDALFRKALKALHVQLREALVEAELDDLVVLRSFPRASLSRLEVFEGGQRSAAYDQVWLTERRGIAVGDAVEPDDSTTIGTSSRWVQLTIDGATIGTSLDWWSWFERLFPWRGKRGREGKRSKTGLAVVASAESAVISMDDRIGADSGFSGILWDETFQNTFPPL